MFLPASFRDRALARDPESTFEFGLVFGFRVRLLSLAPWNDKKVKASYPRNVSGLTLFGIAGFIQPGRE